MTHPDDTFLVIILTKSIYFTVDNQVVAALEMEHACGGKKILLLFVTEHHY